jgi:hypothetical protein
MFKTIKTAEQIAAEAAEATAQARIAELKSFLRDTDHKVLPDYKDRAGMSDEDYANVVAQRKDWYDELKTIEASLE